MDVNIDTADKPELERVTMMVNINKIQQDIVESQQRIAKIYQDLELDKKRWEADSKKLEAETLKIQKEGRWYPLLPIMLGFLGVIIALYKQ